MTDEGSQAISIAYIESTAQKLQLFHAGLSLGEQRVLDQLMARAALAPSDVSGDVQGYIEMEFSPKVFSLPSFSQALGLGGPDTVGPQAQSAKPAYKG